MNARCCACAVSCGVLLAWNQVCTAAVINFGGQPAEISISSVSERTVRVQLSPIDATEKPVPVTPSTVVVPFTSTNLWQARELSGEREFRIGRLRVQVTASPLTVAMRREDGKRVQQLGV